MWWHSQENGICFEHVWILWISAAFTYTYVQYVICYCKDYVQYIYMKLCAPCNIFVWVLLHSCPKESMVHRFEPLRFNPYFPHPVTNCAVGQNRFKEAKWFKEVNISTRKWRQSDLMEWKWNGSRGATYTGDSKEIVHGQCKTFHIGVFSLN